MPYFITKQPKLTVACLALLMSACASEPTPSPAGQPISGDLMLRESQGIASLGDRWKSGKDLVDRGNRMVTEGQAKINEGNTMIEEGQKIIRESEESYKSIKK